MSPLVHAGAGTLALLTVATFITSTLVAELFLDHAAITTVKRSIAYAIPLLVLFVAATGGSGFSLAKRRSGTVVARKSRRMQYIALNGILVLAPAALFLYQKASTAAFDSVFYAVQIAELLAGMLQLALLGLNFRDGFILAGRRRNPKAAETGRQ